ncbi:hypothetical protein PMIN01_05905 [Paraphaeosphaeria minitans]|uniref:Uncharacterized protein n=1 Tax=Paraphaeosphaeria minitans TaxID=565426 RepID=A0A9P6GJ92_9PLEO|nr:hypothetical protein PMIN01_05905 [Paraphaeosphaeria minitans]
MGYMNTATRTMVDGCGEGCVCSLTKRGPCGAVRARRVRGGQTARGAASRACGAIETLWSAEQAAGPRLESLGVVSSSSSRSRRDDWEGSRKHKAQACMSALIGARPGRCEDPHTAARHTLAVGDGQLTPLRSPPESTLPQSPESTLPPESRVQSSESRVQSPRSPAQPRARRLGSLWPMLLAAACCTIPACFTLPLLPPNNSLSVAPDAQETWGMPWSLPVPARILHYSTSRLPGILHEASGPVPAIPTPPP